MSRAISKKNVLVTIAAAGILGVGIAAPTVAFAQDDKGSTTTEGGYGGQVRADHQDELAEALAAELGISKDKVAAALTKVQDQLKPERKTGDQAGKGPGTEADRQAALKTRLDQAVKDGKITQAEADAIIKASAAGVLGGGGPGGRPGGGHGPGANNQTEG